MEVDYSKLPEADVVVNYIIARLRRGLYSLVLVTGLPGSGKSSTCLRLRELIQTKLNTQIDPLRKITIDTLLELLDALKNSKPGDVLVIEELSVLFPSRRAMSADNVAIGKILDTCRKKQVILLTNAPLLNSIDSNIRALANILVETLRVKRTEGVVISKAFRLQTDVRSSKTYLHRFQRKGRDVNLVITRKPSNDTWNKYEQEKDAFIDKLYTKLEEQQDKKSGKDKPKPIKPLTTKELQIYDLYFTQGLTQYQIADKLKVSQPSVWQIVQKIIKKSNISKENRKKKLINGNQTPIKLNLYGSDGKDLGMNGLQKGEAA